MNKFILSLAVLPLAACATADTARDLFNGTDLTGSSSAGSLVLTSAGAIVDDATADVAVTANATLSGTSIDLGDVGAGAANNDTNFGTLTFTAPASAGTYEFRYALTGSDTIVKTSESFTVTN